MATDAQLNANRQNAQLSSGPVSDAGLDRSSKNATKHGFSGLTLVVTPDEMEAYTNHTRSFFERYMPESASQGQLVQQMADFHWSFHQIFVEQTNVLSLMNALNKQRNPDDLLATAAALSPLSRTLNTLNLYEVRRRRAAKSVEEEFLALQKSESERQAKELAQAAVLYKSHKAKGKTFDPARFGFVCSLDDVLDYIEGQNNRAEVDEALIPAGFEKLRAETEAEIAEILSGK